MPKINYRKYGLKDIISNKRRKHYTPIKVIVLANYLQCENNNIDVIVDDIFLHKPSGQKYVLMPFTLYKQHSRRFNCEFVEFSFNSKNYYIGKYKE